MKASEEKGGKISRRGRRYRERKENPLQTICRRTMGETRDEEDEQRSLPAAGRLGRFTPQDDGAILRRGLFSCGVRVAHSSPDGCARLGRAWQFLHRVGDIRRGARRD